MTAPLKFNFKGRVEAETTGTGEVVVTSGDGYFYQGHEVIIMSDLKKYFTPVNCEAVDLMEKTEGAAEACGCDGYYQLFGVHRPGCVHAFDPPASCPYCHAPDRSGETCDQCGRLL